MENYSLKDHRNNPEYACWNDDYDKYIEIKNEQIQSQNAIENYLMMLSGEKADIVLDVRNKDLYKNVWIMNLLKNIGLDEKTN